MFFSRINSSHCMSCASISAVIVFTAYCGIMGKSAHATEQAPDHELREIISAFNIEGLSLSLTPLQAHDDLVAAGYQVHKGTEPGHGIYWKNETNGVTKRIRLKSSIDRIYQIHLSFAEKDGDKAWRLLFNDIKGSLGTATRLCETATERVLSCVLVSEKPTQLSAEVTASQSSKANRIRVKLDQRTTKISIKSNLSFGSPRKQ
ncbi:hypothetical protein MNBD_GAMMA26-955 [hydrothermal vent metagenome]|uniref:Uncharacterized protein n=1 Tax=hydrothermal vent metagenome TaxID=652676 RepID=A0A3B1B2F1_9ZZZZ